ncbi:hypothetical protein [Gemmiger sp.]
MTRAEMNVLKEKVDKILGDCAEIETKLTGTMTDATDDINGELCKRTVAPDGMSEVCAYRDMPAAKIHILCGNDETKKVVDRKLGDIKDMIKSKGYCVVDGIGNDENGNEIYIISVRHKYVMDGEGNICQH